MRETPNQEKGITLIALVLTIIVLMILAAVSVATLTGDNGILTKAQEAKETAKKAEIEEQLRLAELSAKIKKEGGAITVSDLLQELESQGVDFETGEGGNSIIIDGKYVIEIQEKDGELKFEDQGTVSKPKPKVVSIEIVDETPTTIKVKVSTLRNEGGTLKYYIKEEGAKDYGPGEEQEGEEYTFKDLDPDTTYTRIKVEAKAPNGETAYKEIEISNVPSLEKPEAVTLSYRANGQTIGADTWTQGPVTVTVKVNSNIVNTQGYTLQTAKSTGVERTGKLDWQETASQSFTTKGRIYARLIDKTNGSKGKEYTKAIDKIDTTPPIINMEETQASVVATTNSITITASATDNEESGIAKYSFSKDNGTTWKPTEGIVDGQTENSYTFNNLQTGTYSLKIKVTDKVGNEAISEPITQSTENVPGGKENIGMGGLTESAEIGIDYELADWTSGDVNVSLINNSGNANYYLQYQKCKVDMTDYSDDRWENYEEGTPIVFTENGVILARLTDNKTPEQTGNVGTIATGNVTKIDKTAPSEATIEFSSTTACINTSITATVTPNDNSGGSGVDITKCKWIYTTSNNEIGTDESMYTGGNFSDNPQILTLTATTQGSYYLHVLTVDNVGLKCETVSECVTIDNTVHFSNGYSGSAITSENKANDSSGFSTRALMPKGSSITFKFNFISNGRRLCWWCLFG